MRVLARALTLFALLVVPAAAWAAWPQDASIPTYPFATPALRQRSLHSATSSDNGLLVVAEDSMATGETVRAQCVDNTGAPLWGSDGVTLASPAGIGPSFIAPDDGGGAYVAYHIPDVSPGSRRLLVARIRKNGTLAWGAPTQMSTSNPFAVFRAIVSAGSAGVVVVWGEYRNGVDFHLFGQRLDTLGVKQWADSGIVIAGGPGYHELLPGGTARAPGTTCLAWSALQGTSVYAQEWNDNGSPAWTPGGVLVSSTATFGPYWLGSPHIAVNAFGDMYVAWLDGRNGGAHQRIYGQLIANGTPMWAPGGLMVSRQNVFPGGEPAISPPVVSPSGGVWFSWVDHDSLINLSYARTAWFGGSGAELTPLGGVVLSNGAPGSIKVATAIGATGRPTSAIHNTSGGQTLRSQYVNATNQTLAHSPLITNDADGTVTTQLFNASPDGSGGLYLAWRDAAKTRIRVARAAAGGCLGGDAPALESVSDVAGDEGGVVQLCWQRACHDTAFTTLYRVLRRPAGSGAAWTQVATYDAIGLAMNCYQAPTDADSSGAGAADYEWRIVWDDEISETDSSNIVVGHSRDNLAPGPVGNVTVVFHPGASLRPAGTALSPAGASPQRAEFGPYNTVSWTASPSSDVAGIRVYRDAWPGFTPSQANIVADLPPSQLTVNDGADHAYYYKVVAYDDVGNTAPSAGAVTGGSDVVTVFSTDFESGMPSQMTAQGAAIEGTQGYASLGPPGNQFGASFLRYTSVPLYDTKLVLHNLQPHTAVSLGFLLGVIDSWDGTELFQVRVDGALLFNHWFQLAQGDSSDYIAPPGVLLSRGTDLGFSGCCYYNRDRAYDIGADPTFQNIPHTADSLVVVWSLSAISGPAAQQWQGGSDESWAIDNVRVKLTIPTAGVPGETAPSALELAGTQPNPSRDGRLSVHFALPGAEPARLELFDVAGRRLGARDVGAMGAGRHVVDLGEGLRLRAGVYLVRLTQGGANRTVRAAVMR